MATQTTSRNSGRESIDQTTQRLADLNERLGETARKADDAYVDSYEKTLKSYAGLHERVGSTTQIDWVASVASAQASFVRDFAEVTASANRELLRS